MIHHGHAFARAGLVGNPSDGYFGATISFAIRNYSTRVRLWESPRLEIRPTSADFRSYENVSDLMREVSLYGYYGGIRLIKATIRRFFAYQAERGQMLDPKKTFTIEYESDVPRLVGLSGSSAIVIATLRSLMSFYGVTVEKHLLPTLALSVERDELKITAGLQDRVIQTYEGLVYMDFDRESVTTKGFGRYEPLIPKVPLPLYVAFDPNRAEISDVTHRNLRQLFDSGDAGVVSAMQELRQITGTARQAILSGDLQTLAAMNNRGYEIRRTIMAIAPENHRMVETARAAGASAAFAGSGGAISGLYTDGPQYQRLSDALAKIGCTTVRPLIWDI